MRIIAHMVSNALQWIFLIVPLFPCKSATEDSLVPCTVAPQALMSYHSFLLTRSQTSESSQRRTWPERFTLCSWRLEAWDEHSLANVHVLCISDIQIAGFKARSVVIGSGDKVYYSLQSLNDVRVWTACFTCYIMQYFVPWNLVDCCGVWRGCWNTAAISGKGPPSHIESTITGECCNVDVCTVVYGWVMDQSIFCSINAEDQHW